jgi:hypothetical protein
VQIDQNATEIENDGFSDGAVERVRLHKA